MEQVSPYQFKEEQILVPYLIPTRSVTETLYKCYEDHTTSLPISQNSPKLIKSTTNSACIHSSNIINLRKQDSYICTCLAKLSRVESLFIATAICPMQLVMFGGHQRESDVKVSERDWFRASSPCERASSASCVDCCNPHIPSICCSVRGSI